MRANGAYIAPCAGLEADVVIFISIRRMEIVRDTPSPSLAD